jgi:hypothetical protein
MFGSPKLEQLAIEATYEDTCTVYRSEDDTSGGLTKKTLETVIQDAICAISSGGLSASDQTDGANLVEQSDKLFLGPTYLLKPGDVIEVKRFGRYQPTSTLISKYECAGKSMNYATHQEVKVKVRDMA